MDKQAFNEALVSFLGVPADVTVTSINEDVSYQEGCPTCGGDYEFTIYVGGIRDGKHWYKTYENKRLQDFIQSLI